VRSTLWLISYPQSSRTAGLCPIELKCGSSSGLWLNLPWGCRSEFTKVDWNHIQPG
jgi:hypothetical protein